MTMTKEVIPKKEKKNNLKTIKFSLKEKKAIDKFLKKTNVTFSDLVRFKLNEVIPQIKKPI